MDYNQTNQTNTYTYPINFENNQQPIRKGTEPIDNDTFTENTMIQEQNKDERIQQLINLWEKTNFWIKIIGIYFLGKIIYAIASFTIKIIAGYTIIETITSLT